MVYPLPYLQEIWHYREANTGFIRYVIKEFNWERIYPNTSIYEKVNIFNKTILNILSNFIPHETIVCDDKNPWFDILSTMSSRTLKYFYPVFQKKVLC